MKDLFKPPLLKYIIIASILILLTGIGLLPVTDNYLVLFIILLTLFIAFFIFLRFFNSLYLVPIYKVIEMLSKMEKGNYRVRLSYRTSNVVIEELIYRLNSLARHHSELSIQEKTQSRQLSTLINNSNSGLILIDQKGYVHHVNQKFLNMFGGEERDYKGYLYYDVLDEGFFQEIVQQVFLYEKNVKQEFSYYNSIHKHYYEIVGTPIFNSKKRIRGVVLAFYDITELKKLEVMRKDFVANVSHELRTPITSITGFSETLLEDGLEDKESAMQFLKIIHKESERMQLLIEDLLTLSKLEQENFQLPLNDINIIELTDEIIPQMQVKAEKKGLGFSLSLEEQLEFRANKESVKQIFINLIDNAIHYTPVNGEIRVSITSNKEYVHIQVSDTGIGIEKEQLPRIFERFYRVDKARSRNTGGTGLGLAIVKHIVEVHKGRIEIESELNKGTDVHVYLPK